MSLAVQRFKDALAQLPLIAILRGVTPAAVVDIGLALLDAQFVLIEVPLNSPDALRSIERLAVRCGERAVIGAGTVLTESEAFAVRDAGGQMAISPCTDARVIEAAKAAGLASAPGFRTPSEAFAALRAGADGLKLFPCEDANPAALAALRAVLPASVPVVCVGGVRDDNLQPWLDAGASGFGLGSSLYKPGFTPDDVRTRAQSLVQAFRTATIKR